jgi:hypothetical protein
MERKYCSEPTNKVISELGDATLSGTPGSILVLGFTRQGYFCELQILFDKSGPVSVFLFYTCSL